MSKPTEISRVFANTATATAHASGKPVTFILCVVVVIAWAVSGPLFKFSDTWQLVINTGTTIVTFLMVFLIQNTQNRDGAAIQAKLDELVLATKAANLYVGIEDLTSEELEELKAECRKRAVASGQCVDVTKRASKPKRASRATKQKSAGRAAH